MTTLVRPTAALGFRSILVEDDLLDALSRCGVEADSARIDRVVDADGSVVVDLRAGLGGPDGRFVAQFVDGDVVGAAREIDASLGKSRRGQIPKGSTIVAADPSRSMLLRPAGYDERIVGLDILHDLSRANDALIGFTGEVRAVDLLSHRLGKRAVLRVYGADRSVVVKVMKARTNLTEVSQRLARGLEPSGAVVPVIGCLVDRNATVWADAGSRVGSQWGPLLAEPGRIVATLRRFHAGRPVPGVWRHGAAQEIGVVRRHAGLVALARPELAALAERSADEVCAALSSLPEGGGALIHRDLHPGQIAVQREQVRLLDLDTAAVGDPAVDVGNLAAHLRLRGDSEGAESLVRRYRGLDRAAVTAWADAALFRLTAQRVAVDPETPWPSP